MDTGRQTGQERPGMRHLQSDPSLTASESPFDYLDISSTREWPLLSFLELGPYPSAVPCARLHVRYVLRDWGMAAQAGQVELVLSELVTNAVLASRRLECATPVRMWLLSDRDEVMILVWDASTEPVPSATIGDELSDSGRGLMLVNEVSRDWSWQYTPEISGKVVWSVCAGTEVATTDAGRQNHLPDTPLASDDQRAVRADAENARRARDLLSRTAGLSPSSSKRQLMDALREYRAILHALVLGQNRI
jgi:anti-sigma regulatory factor (Ser/Thr protein kinase)